MDQFEDQGTFGPRPPTTPGRSLRGVEVSLAQQTATAFITLHIQYSVPGNIASLPAADALNNATLKDRWVPRCLWLWTASRIEYGTDSKQLKQT